MTGLTHQSAETPSPPVSMTVLLAVTMVVSAVPLNMMGVLAAVILPDLGITRSQLGLALSVVTAAGGVLSLSAGRITDAVGGRTTLRSAFALGAVALGLVAVAPSYGWLLVAMVLTGMMQSFSNPSTNWMIATYYPPGRRGLVTGVKQSGVQVSLLLCGVALPVIAQAAGWRIAVASLIAIPLLGALGTVTLPPDRPSRERRAHQRPRIRHPSTIRWLAAYSLTTGIGQSAVLAFVPLYANEEIGLGLTAAGIAGATIGTFGVASRIAWTRYAERFRTMITPLGIITGGSMLAALSLLSALELGPSALWLGVIVAGTTLAASNAVVMLSTVIVASPGTIGRASGLVIVFFLAGNSIGPTAFGWLVDQSGRYLIAWTFVLASFMTALIVLWLWARSEHRLAG